MDRRLPFGMVEFGDVESPLRVRRPSARALVSSAIVTASPVVASAPSASLGVLPSDRKDLAPFVGAMNDLFEP